MADREKIQKIIDEQISPQLQSHGGDIELVSVEEDGTVKVKLTGACQGCPGAAMTLRSVVENMLAGAGAEFTKLESV